MATPDDPVELARQIDHWFGRMEEWWDRLPEEARDLDEDDDMARAELTIADPAVFSARRRWLDQLAVQGKLSEAQTRQLRRVEELQARYEPILEALRRGDPIPDIAA